ncbi:MAG: L,D-transpeptidase family protein [Pseudomonadota bacterium]
MFKAPYSFKGNAPVVGTAAGYVVTATVAFFATAGVWTSPAFAELSVSMTRVDATPPTPAASPVRAEKRARLAARFGPGPVAYLEGLKGKPRHFLAPSEIDPRYTMALYVNVAARGPRAQRMWVLQRDAIGGRWKLGMSDKRYWRRRGLPADITPRYSWKVSTGRKYRGDRRSGPTPQGVFSLDERRHRMTRGYRGPGMIHAMFLDLHYRSGRASGVAFHGTTRNKYRILGRIDSHGCIRMTQSNALALMNRIQGRDNVIPEALRWGDVPRFWQRERGRTRLGYRRDGQSIPAATDEVADRAQPTLTTTATRTASFRPGSDETPVTRGQFSTGEPDVLTKVGYRTIIVLFSH